MVRVATATIEDLCMLCWARVVACKQEFDIPLGRWRLWITEVYEGEYPDIVGYMIHLPQCNHCENAPCVNVCPTGALYHTPEGFVRLDKDLCIGCRACTRACPYNAVYIDPRTNKADKCSFCEHLVETGLEPACVAACPTGARIFGDLEDPGSLIGRLYKEGKIKPVGAVAGRVKSKLFFAPLGAFRPIETRAGAFEKIVKPEGWEKALIDKDVDMTRWNPNADPRVQPGAIPAFAEEPALGQWAKIRLTKDPSVSALADIVKFTRENLSRAAVALLILMGLAVIWTQIIRPVHHEG
ncbi:MAG: 4Fe-4S dicluster domain-containing protein [Thermoprotei archaeon]|nr:4Fe-4S dicluster domain-containing protein [Thermoprotei archaeon]